jgi:hypothetical protein
MRITRISISLLILLLLFWSVPCFAQGPYYRWIDKDGNVHFSNAPPGDATGAAPLELRDRPENIRFTRARSVDEVGEQLTDLMNQARVLIQSGSNSSANKTELRSIAAQLDEKLREYESRVKLAVAAETNPVYRKVIMDTSSNTREGVKTYVGVIRKYVDAKEVLDQTAASRLSQEQRLSGSKIADDVRVALRNSKMNFRSWHPYRNPNSLVQVGMNEFQIKGLAGEAEMKEFYVGTIDGRSMAIAGWYYVSTDRTQTALLEFEIGTDSLLRINQRP